MGVGITEAGIIGGLFCWLALGGLTLSAYFFFFEAFFFAFFAFFAAITLTPFCRPRSVSRSGFSLPKPVPGRGIVLRIVCVLSSDPRFCGVKVTRSQFDAPLSNRSRPVPADRSGVLAAVRQGGCCRGAALALPRCGKEGARRGAAGGRTACRGALVAALRQGPSRPGAIGSGPQPGAGLRRFVARGSVLRSASCRGAATSSRPRVRSLPGPAGPRRMPRCGKR